MRFVVGVVAAVAAIQAFVFALVPFAQSGALGENTGGEPFLQPLTTGTYWLTAVPCLAAVAILVSCVVNVSKYPRSSRAAIVRTGSLIGFALINLGYFVFAIRVGVRDENSAMFGYSVLGLTGSALAGVLLRARPRDVVG